MGISYYAETPDQVADRMVALAEIDGTHSVLEPSAGRGALIRAIRRAKVGRAITACEANANNAKFLDEKLCMPVAYRDCMLLPKDKMFDRVVMNPPGRGKDFNHVRNAYDHLRRGGILVALVHNHISD